MDKNRVEHNDVWVDNRLALLNPDSGWEPNVLNGLTRLREKHSQAQVRNSWMWIAVAVGLACLTVMVLPSPRVLAHRCLQSCVAVWQSIAQTSPPREPLKPEGDRKVAPNFALTDAEGKNVELSALKGRVVALNFWATWCHGCQEEIPSFVEIQKKYADRRLTIVGISMDDDGWKSVRPWIKQKRVNYPIVIGNSDLGQKYRLVGMPLTVLVDRGGRIANSHAGVVDRATFEQQIETLLSEQAKVSAN